MTGLHNGLRQFQGTYVLSYPFDWDQNLILSEMCHH